MLYIDRKKAWFLVSAFTSLIFLFGYNLAGAAWADNLKAYWPLDSDSHDYTTDFSGTDTSVSYTTGKFNGALDMPNSASSYVTVGELELITEANKGDDLYYSFAGWVNPDAIGSDMRILGKNSTNFAAPYTYYFINIRSTGVVRICFGSGCFDSTGTISASTWTHLAINVHTHGVGAKFDVSFYFNGNLDSGSTDVDTSGTLDQQSGLGNARIGLERFSTGQTDAPFNGLIDDLAIWNRALTTDEIDALQLDSLETYLLAPPPAETYVSIDFPTSSQVMNVNDFDHFDINFSRATSSFSSTFFQFRVATSTDNLSNCPAFNETLGYQNGCWYSSDIYPIGTTTDPIFEEFFWPTQLSSSSYYGRVLMFDYIGGEYVEIASYGNVNFVLNSEDSGFNSYFPEPGMASTTDPDFGLLGNFLVKALKWLFIPPSGTWDLFTKLGTVLSVKPPIGYFTLVSNSILSIDDEQTGAYELAAIGDLSLFQSIRTVLTSLIWLGFGAFLFRRLKNLNL